MIRTPFELFNTTPGATATGASAVSDQKPTESRENRLYTVNAVRQTGPIPTREEQMNEAQKDNLAAKTVALVMKKFRKEFPGMAKEWAGEVHRRASELLYQPIYDYGFTNVEALAEFVMVEIRLIHQSGIAKTTARQADMRRRAAWKTLEASGSTSTTTQEHADECIENRWSIFIEAYMATQLMRHVDAAGSRLLCSGDMRQLQPIGPGSGMALLAQRLGQAELTEVRRQQRVEDRELAMLFYDRDASGRVILGTDTDPKSRAQVQAKSQQIWQQLEAGNKIDAWDTRQQAMDALALDWFDSEYGIDNRLVLVHTHEDGKAIAQRLRSGLRDRGLLEGEEFKVKGRQGERALDLVMARGDRVRITENAAELGLTNGDLAEVVAIRANDGGHDLRLRVQARGEREAFSVAVRTQDFNHFNQGYADTIHKSQGQGQPAVFHYVNPQQTDNQTMLVAFTRMTHHYRLYGAEEDLELARMKLGLDRMKQNAIQQLAGVSRNQQIGLDLL